MKTITKDFLGRLKSAADWSGNAAVNEAFEMLNSLASVDAPDDDWSHLRAYGYAPGGYMSRCHRCNIVAYDLDKRAICCRPCAEKAYAEQIASASPITRETGNPDSALASGVTAESVADLERVLDILAPIAGDCLGYGSETDHLEGDKATVWAREHIRADVAASLGALRAALTNT